MDKQAGLEIPKSLQFAVFGSNDEEHTKFLLNPPKSFILFEIHFFEVIYEHDNAVT